MRTPPLRRRSDHDMPAATDCHNRRPYPTPLKPPDHVGCVRVPGGGVGAAAAANDAEQQGGGALHGAQRVLPGAQPLLQLRALGAAGGQEGGQGGSC